MYKNNKGFTFIELIVVIVIVAIVAVAYFFTGKNHTTIAQSTEARAFIEKVVAQEKIYRTEMSKFYTVNSAVSAVKDLKLDTNQNKYFKTFKITVSGANLAITLYPKSGVKVTITGNYNMTTNDITYTETFS
jgi:prepilin-type N-terminal cleavage/methylation domain-containing protein